MIHRIALFGAESTGKTRLAQALAERFDEPWVAEYVREFWQARAGDIRAGDLDTIAREQRRREDAAADSARRLLFCDTELLTNLLWARLLFPGAEPAWLAAEADRRSRRYALYLLCDTDLSFEHDPQRCFPDPADRERCRALWRQTLLERDLQFMDISGTGAERLRRAVAAVQAVLRDG